MADSDSDLSALLRFPLYALTTETRTSIAGGLSEAQREYWSTRHELDQLRDILKALEWAEHQPNFPYSGLLPGLRFSDKSLYEYLCQIKGDFEKIVSEFVEDDGPDSP